MAIDMLKYLFRSYGVVYETDLEDNDFNTMGPYDPAEPLTIIINQHKKGQEFARSGEQTIANYMMVSKGITLLAQTKTFNNNIRECRQQSTKIKTWANFNIFFHRSHRE